MASDPGKRQGMDPPTPEIPQGDANLDRELDLDQRDASPDADRLVEGGPDDTQGAGRREELASPGVTTVGDDGFDDHER